MGSACIAGLVSFFIFLTFGGLGIYAGDTGDLVTAAAQFGIPHPPGYPLYTFLGSLFSKLPIATVAWRVGLLSSLSHALAVALVYLVTFRLTRHHAPAIFAFLLLLGNYLFFLYSVTAEVFGMLDFFVISFFFLAEKLTRPSVHKKWLFILVFAFGLSLSHHYMILCIVPALWYLLRVVKFSIVHIKVLRLFLLGLVPYFYIPIAARLDAAINWDRPVTWARFIHLITRADYGTFQSGTSIDGGMYQRVLSVKAYLVFVLVDFTWVGVLLLGFGVWWLFVYRKRLFYFWLISLLCIGPFFAFYANFPLAGRFALGTFERFVLPSYVLMAPVIGLGVWQVLHFFSPRLHLALFVVLLIYPITMGSMTVWRFWGIRTDQTAQNFGLDVLASAPESSIVLLVHDTPLFVVQYLRYGLSLRPDVAIIHTARLAYPDYEEVLRLQSPKIIVPQLPPTVAALEFIKANRRSRPIVSNSIIPVDSGWAWVAHGMLYKLVSTDTQIQPQEVIETNMRLWQQFHNPNSGILSRYKHLMLSNVLDEYAQAAIAFGDLLMRDNQIAQAKSFYSKALAYESDGQQYPATIRLGTTLSLLGQCKEALEMFSRARLESDVPQDELYAYEGITWRDCVGDGARAQELFDAFDASKKKAETPLEQL